MRDSTLYSTLWGSVMLLLLPGLLSAQGLGGAAQREQKRRAERPAEPVKTYTEDDLQGLRPLANDPESDHPATAAGDQPPAVPERPVATPRPPAPSPKPTSDGAEDETTRKQDEERWRSRVAEARARLARVREDHAALANLHMVPGMVLVDDSGKAVIQSVEQLQSLTARAKAELDAAQKAFDDLLESGRRAGVPPGWLR